MRSSYDKFYYKKFYAERCKHCKGKGVFDFCVCNHLATVKYRLDQFEIDPPELKYKTWADFRGHGEKGQGSLTQNSFADAKIKALQYCFGPLEINDLGLVLSDRKNKLIIHHRCKTGQNVVIVGNAQSGRSLVAALIIKEVVYACLLHALELEFKCVSGTQLLSAAVWDNDRAKEHIFLDEVIDVDFLVIDNVDLFPKMGHHTSGPDFLKMEEVFRKRRANHRPSIIVCSDNFYQEAVDPRFAESIAGQWGREFLRVITHPKNTVIKLQREVET